jgi:copper resistance protein C
LRSSRVVLVIGALLAASVAASAHSLLLESSPAAGAVVAAPRDVRLRFNGRVEKRLSQMALVDERGEGRVLVPDRDGPPDRLAASLPPLPAGRYRLEWHVLSTDGHVVSGGFGFRVAP